MLKSLLVLITVVLMSTPAMAFAPKGKWKEGGPNPPGHAYGLRARQSSMHDPATCSNPCHDHERDRCDDDRHGDDDDRNDQGDDDGRDNRDLDRRPVPDPSETKRRPERRDDVTSDPRSPREVQDDIREIDVAIRRERDAHQQRMESLLAARNRAVALGRTEEAATFDALIRRERERHADRIARLEARRDQLEQGGQNGGGGPDASDCRPGPSDNGDTRRTAARTSRERVQELTRRIEAEEREYADRRADLEREMTKALIRRDDLRRAEITVELDTWTAQHERRMERLKVRLAVAKSQRATRQTPTERVQADLDDARTEVRRVRRTVSDVESGIDSILADVRWIAGKR